MHGGQNKQTLWGPCEVSLGSPLVLRSGYEWRGCPQAVSREYHRTRNKNKQTNKEEWMLLFCKSIDSVIDSKFQVPRDGQHGVQ
jgi:hypothetical protein